MTDFTELIGIAVANTQSRTEVSASRARILAASDEARRRIERQLHDGVQQRLVRLALHLGITGDSASADEWLKQEIDALVTEVLGVLEDLRETSRGIHPTILSDAGLGAAVRMLARRSTVPVRTDIAIEGRLPKPIEACAYHVVSELLTNTGKHARASLASVEVEVGGALLRLCVSDDGVGGADHTQGSGLIGVRDRVEALGGTLLVSSEPGRGTRVCCEMPTVSIEI
jgi:signal transduction histidine kinase